MLRRRAKFDVMKPFSSQAGDAIGHVTLTLLFFVFFLSDISTRFCYDESRELVTEKTSSIRQSSRSQPQTITNCLTSAAPATTRQWRLHRKRRRRTRTSAVRRRLRKQEAEIQYASKVQEELQRAIMTLQADDDEPCLTEVHSDDKSGKRFEKFDTSETHLSRTRLRRSKRQVPGSNTDTRDSKALYVTGHCALMKSFGNTSELLNRDGVSFTIEVWVKANGGQRSPSTLLELFEIPCDSSSSTARVRSRRVWTLGVRSRSDPVASCPVFYFKLHSSEPRLSTVVNSASCYTPETWTHIAVTYDGFLLKLLVNGVTNAAAPAELIGGLENNHDKPQACPQLAVGCRADGSHCYRGALDDIHATASSKTQLDIKRGMYQQHEDDQTTFYDWFDSNTLDQWDAACNNMNEPFLIDDNSPSSTRFSYPSVSAPPCGKTVCDNPEVALSYANQWSLRRPKRVRYQLVNVSNDDGTNPMLLLRDVERQRTHLNSIFQLYNITWLSELRHVTNSSLRRKTIGCDPAKIGNRQCNRECMHERMGHDGGDCDVDVSPCAPELKGNGHCDVECNKRYHGWDEGDCCNPSITDTDETCFDPSSPFRAYLSVTEYKRVLNSDNSAQLSLLFANWTNPNSIGMATFPWDKEVFSVQGGTVVQLKPYVGASEMAGIVHELGHNLGLLHVHHGLRRDVNCDNDCVEVEPSMLKGDLCRDTNPTPVNTVCGDPVTSNEHCGNHLFTDTPYTNFMSYADGSCQDQFTPQQIGRMHCYLDLVYLNWRDDEKLPVIPLRPEVVAASVRDRTVTIAWLPPIGIESRGGSNCDARCRDNGSLRQYAIKATSPVPGDEQHSTAEQATGPPDQEGCTMRGMNFWMALANSGVMRSCDETCYIDFEFETEVVPSLLRLWITYGTENSVGVRNIQLRHTDSTVTSLGAHAAQCDVPLTLRINTDKKISGVRVYVQHTYTAIDAIEISSKDQHDLCTDCREVRYNVIRIPAFGTDKEWISTESLHFTDTNLQDGVEYTYSIAPVDGDVTGKPTSSVTYFLGEAICGDGIIQCASEDCDDGNKIADDGCSSSCKVEHGYRCSGQPSECQVRTDLISDDVFQHDVMCTPSLLKGYIDQWAIHAQPYVTPDRVDGVDVVMSLDSSCSNPNDTMTKAPDSMTSHSGSFCDAIVDQRKVWHACGQGKAEIMVTFATSVHPSSLLLYLAGQFPIRAAEIQVSLIDTHDRLHVVQSKHRISSWCTGSIVHVTLDDVLARNVGATNRVVVSVWPDSVSIDAVALRSRGPAINDVETMFTQSTKFQSDDLDHHDAFDLRANLTLGVTPEQDHNLATQGGALEQVLVTESLDTPEWNTNLNVTSPCIGEHCEFDVNATDDVMTESCPYLRISKANVICYTTNLPHDNDTFCNVTCEDGYQPITTRKIKCVPDAMSAVQPCVPITCPRPTHHDAPLAVEVTCSNGHDYGAVCNVTCLSGDRSQIQCTLLGVWSPVGTPCQTLCARPPRISYASMTSSRCLTSRRASFERDHSCKYRCTTGYSVAQRTSGTRRSFRMTCDGFGQWQGPGCQPVMCERLPEVYTPFLNCTKSFFVGSVCTLTCDGQVMDEPHDQMTCSVDGTWQGKFPTCASLLGACSHPKSSADVSFTCEGYKIGKTCIAKCDTPQYDIIIGGELQSAIGSNPRDRLDPVTKQKTIVCTDVGRWFPDPSSLECVDECGVEDVEDGWCDPGNNRAHCNWDGGDCCASNTTSGKVEPFPSTCTVRCECKDPRSLEFQQRLNSTRRQNDISDTTAARALLRGSNRRRGTRGQRRARNNAHGSSRSDAATPKKTTNRKSRRRRKSKQSTRTRTKANIRDRRVRMRKSRSG